jgi:hypothetical protein
MSMKRTIRRGVTLAALAVAGLGLGAAPASAAKIDYGIAPNTLPLNANDLNLMDQGKVDFVRLPFDWGTVQPAPGDCTPTGGACNWAVLDGQIAALDNVGISVLPNINQSAPWVNNDIFKPPTNNIPAWEDFVQAAAQRYGPGGAAGLRNPITDWQIWNEPGSNGDFSPKPNAKKYGKILKAAGDTIHDVNKKAKVYVGGLFPDTGPKGIPADKFLTDLYKVKKIDKSFDVVAIHPYSPDPKKGVYKQVNDARKAMDKAGDKKAEIAVTELGYASGCPSCSKNNKPPVVVKNEKEQSKALKDSFNSLQKKANKLNLTSIIWFTWRDGAGPCSFCFTSGLLDENGNPKPAYNAFKKEA